MFKTPLIIKIKKKGVSSTGAVLVEIIIIVPNNNLCLGTRFCLNNANTKNNDNGMPNCENNLKKLFVKEEFSVTLSLST